MNEPSKFICSFSLFGRNKWVNEDVCLLIKKRPLQNYIVHLQWHNVTIPKDRFLIFQNQNTLLIPWGGIVFVPDAPCKVEIEI